MNFDFGQFESVKIPIFPIFMGPKCWFYENWNFKIVQISTLMKFLRQKIGKCLFLSIWSCWNTNYAHLWEAKILIFVKNETSKLSKIFEKDCLALSHCKKSYFSIRQKNQNLRFTDNNKSLQCKIQGETFSCFPNDYDFLSIGDD